MNDYAVIILSNEDHQVLGRSPGFDTPKAKIRRSFPEMDSCEGGLRAVTGHSEMPTSLAASSTLTLGFLSQ